MYPTMPGMPPMMSGGPGMMPPGMMGGQMPMGMMPSMNMMPPSGPMGSMMMGGPPMGRMGFIDDEPFYDGDYKLAGCQTVVQAPPMMMERHFNHSMMQAPQGPSFEMEPEFLERVVEIPRVNIDHRERLVEVPQPQVVDRIVEVPQIQEIIKEEPGGHIAIPVTREAPVIEFAQEKLPPMEIAHVEYQDRYVEVPQIQEVLRVIPRIEVREIPIERIIQVPKKIIQEIERPIFRPVPHLIQQQVERQIPVPRTQIQTVEVVKQVPMPVMQPVDVQVNYPMPVPSMMPQAMMFQQVPVPVPQPYAVEVEKRVDVPQIQTQVVEKRVEVPVAVPVPQVQTVQQVQQPVTRQVVQPVQSQKIFIGERVHAPVAYGAQREVGSRVISTQMLAPQTMAMSYAAPTPPTPMTNSVVQEVVAAPMATGYGAMQTGQLPTIIGPSQRVGAMTPPTPPVATRAIASAPMSYSNVVPETFSSRGVVTTAPMGYGMGAPAPMANPTPVMETVDMSGRIGTLPMGVPTPPTPPLPPGMR